MQHEECANREFRKKKHEIAQVKAQVEVANLSRKHKNEMFIELQIHGQAFRDDWCEVEPTYWLLLFEPHLRAGELARSRQQNSKFVKIPFSHPILTCSPVIAALQNCESSASRLAVPSRLQRSLLPIRTI